jgi:hypothetical protein
MAFVDFDQISMSEDLTGSPEFRRWVEFQLKNVLFPIDGTHRERKSYAKYYDDFHRHLIPLSDMFLTVDEILETKGLPWYTFSEDPNNDYHKSDRGKEHVPNLLRDLADRQELIDKATDKSKIIYLTVKHFFPNEDWKIIWGGGHFVVTTGTIQQLHDWLVTGDNPDNILIADPVAPTHQILADLMLNHNDWEDDHGMSRWDIHPNMDDFFEMCNVEYG